MTGFLYLIIAFGMFGTILMMTNERRYEFGMLVAIGMQKGRLSVILLTEILLLSFLGGVAGMLLSWPVVYYLQEVPIRLSGEMKGAFIDYGFEPVFPAQLDPDSFIQQTAVVLCLSILMALYPLFRIRKMDCTTLIRR
jgi:ABC-type antimicrobial peptide transport system permease subunit